MMIVIRVNYSCYKQLLQYLIIHHSFIFYALDYTIQCTQRLSYLAS